MTQYQAAEIGDSKRGPLSDPEMDPFKKGSQTFKMEVHVVVSPTLIPFSPVLTVILYLSC